MLGLIILLPFLSFISIFFGNKIGTGITYITIFNTFVALILTIFLGYDIISYSSVYKLNISQWLSVEYLNLSWTFCFDSLTVTLLFIVLFISLLVHIYSVSYMAHDPHLPRFMSYLSLFTLFMLILITANNFLQLFCGWEGVGLCSYLLINFWFTRIQANKSAIKAMLINRIGDFFILLAFFGIYKSFNSLDYDVVFSLVPMLLNITANILGKNINFIDLICLFLFLGAMGKSAQLGLHTWLPDAMEGPTPVSALIHAATMVTAGVFLLARCSFFFEFSPIVLNLVVFVGGMTSIFAALTGLLQNDIKKVIAYSTCSQLGYMIFACGLSSYDVGIFHLSNHAFFKALLFLGAGSIIHAVSDEQDMRKMGGLKLLLPISYISILIGSIALIGFPFLSGFYSKDSILEVAFAKYTVLSHFTYILGIFAAFCTAFYSTRLLFLVFLSTSNSLRLVILKSHEGSINLILPLLILIFFSLVIGFLTKDLLLGFGTNFWGNSILILPSNYLLIDIEFINITYKILPLAFTIVGCFFSFFLYAKGFKYFLSIKKNIFFKYIYYTFLKKFYIDRLYNQLVAQSILYISYNFSYNTLDRGFFEYIGPFGITKLINNMSEQLKYIHLGKLHSYIVFSFLFFIFFHLFLLFLSF